MLNWSTVMTAISAFGILASVLFQFFNVHPSEKRYVTIKTMRVILVVLFLFSLYMTIQGGGPGGGGLVNGPATAEPTVSLPDPTPSPTPEPHPGRSDGRAHPERSPSGPYGAAHAHPAAGNGRPRSAAHSRAPGHLPAGGV